MNLYFMKTLLLVFALAGISPALRAQNGATVEIRNEPSPAPKPAPPSNRVRIASKRSSEARAFALAGNPYAEGGSQTLIVQTSKFDEKMADELREDMAVMSRILEKATAEMSGQRDKVLGLELVVHGLRSPRNLYLEDYGPIFTLNVSMPLREIATDNPKEKVSDKDIDVEWERARSELFGGKSQGWEGPSDKNSRPFDAREVDRLKNNLIECLKNAANIRHLKAEQWITVVVRGRGNATLTEVHGDDELFMAASDGSERSSTMVLKVRKSDLDHFAKKQMDEFRKRVLVNNY
jgi:hypothetical protein